MPPPLVSIIVLCHNYGRFLAEAIESALHQDYPSLEVLIVDDGSTDDSLEVASRFGDRVRILTQANQGLAKTCNRGAPEATGEYIVFLPPTTGSKPRTSPTCWQRSRASRTRPSRTAPLGGSAQSRV